MHGAFARRAVIGGLPAGVSPDTIAGLNAAWLLGTSAMVVLGVLALTGIGALGREPGAVRVPFLIGLFFLGYGVWGFFYRHHHPHFIGFMVIGVLFLAGALLATKPRATS